LHGAEDQIISKAEARAMVTALPDAGLVIIPGAGHLPNLEQPETFNQLLGDFIVSLS
jgi:pimeloyl-ACP methyl ester carboxylesterase